MSFLSSNIDRKGRLIRGAVGVLLLTGSPFGFMVGAWLGVLLLASAALLLFQALMGWCLVKACRIKSKL